MNKKVRIGILGCADIANRYAIKAFQAIDNAEVISIASRDPAKAKTWARRFGIESEKSYESLLLNENIDAVYIPLPVGLHKKWVLKAADAGKHVICEKSLAGDLKSVLEAVNKCRKNDVVLYENLMCEFHPQHKKVISLIRTGDLGKPFVFRSFFGFPPFKNNNIRYSKKLGGGSLNDVAPHMISMARNILGKEPLSVSCSLWEDKNKGVDVQGSALLEFSEGQIALLAFSYCSIYQNNYSLWCSDGIINVNRAYSIPPQMRPRVNIIRSEGLKESKTTINIPPANQFEKIFYDFCDTILHKEQRANKIRDNLVSIIGQAKVMEALRLASKENRKVRLNELSGAINK